MLLCPWLVHAERAADRLHAFFADTYAADLREQPEAATNQGHHEYDDRWTDWSADGRALRRTHLIASLAALDKLSLKDVSDEDRLSARLYRYAAEQTLAAEDLEDHLVRVGQLFGLHNRVYTIIDRMPTRTIRDYENLLGRLHGIPRYVDQNIGILQEGIDRKLTQPQVVVDLVVAQLDKQIQQSSAETALLAGFRNFPSNIPENERTRLHSAAIASYEQEFLPAWRRLRDFMNGPYRAAARPNIGLSSLPGGQALYATMIRRLTTTQMSAEEIHALGLAEVARIESAMLHVAREVGFQGSVQEFSEALTASADQHFSTKDEMLAYCRNIAKIIEPNLPNQFRTIPQLLYGVRPIPEDREQATATNAQAASVDGTTPGWFNLNTYAPSKQFRFDKEALVLHEAVPGHIFQIGIAHTIEGLPEFRHYYGNSAYIEGWALYAESLGGDLGLYHDAFSRFGQLSSERFRAVRLVVDTGIHSMGWSRDQAVDYFRMHAPESSLAEIDRYISWPAQALSYKLGQLEILKLRRDTETRLGSRFDIREFHDVVLKDGVLPLELLREQVEAHYGTAHH